MPPLCTQLIEIYEHKDNASASKMQQQKMRNDAMKLQQELVQQQQQQPRKQKQHNDANSAFTEHMAGQTPWIELMHSRPSWTITQISFSVDSGKTWVPFGAYKVCCFVHHRKYTTFHPMPAPMPAKPHMRFM